MRLFAQTLIVAFVIGAPLLITWALFASSAVTGHQDGKGFHYGEHK